MATEHVCIASPAIGKLKPQHTLLTCEVAKKSKQPCPAQKETQRNEEGCPSPQGVSRMVIVTEIGVCRPQGLRSCWTTPTPQRDACVLAQRDYTGIPGIPLLITPRDERHLGVPPLGMDGEWVWGGENDHRRSTRATHQVHTRNTPGPHQEHTSNTPRLHQEHTSNTPGTQQDHTRNTPGTNQDHTRNTTGPHQDHTRNTSGPHQEHTRSTP